VTGVDPGRTARHAEQPTLALPECFGDTSQSHPYATWEVVGGTGDYEDLIGSGVATVDFATESIVRSGTMQTG
jgi:hypothetical protein